MVMKVEEGVAELVGVEYPEVSLTLRGSWLQDSDPILVLWHFGSMILEVLELMTIEGGRKSQEILIQNGQ